MTESTKIIVNVKCTQPLVKQVQQYVVSSTLGPALGGRRPPSASRLTHRRALRVHRDAFRFLILIEFKYLVLGVADRRTAQRGEATVWDAPWRRSGRPAAGRAHAAVAGCHAATFLHTSPTHRWR
ncbi:unnamed protein product, partial [Brenthis ino]